MPTTGTGRGPSARVIKSLSLPLALAEGLHEKAELLEINLSDAMRRAITEWVERRA